MKVVVSENQRGLYFKKGCFKKVLKPGRYKQKTNKKIVEAIQLDDEIISAYCTPEILKDNRKARRFMVFDEVADREISLHFINGRFKNSLKPGMHAFWNVMDAHTFQHVDVSKPDVPSGIPTYILDKLPSTVCTKVEVADYQKGRLYFNRKFERLLDPGIYYFWNNDTKIEVNYADTRLTQMDITGQEILTLDKVELRINFVCNYKIVDFVKIVTEIDNYEEQMHVAAQLALRDYVGKHTLDEVLANKDEMAEFVYEQLKAKGWAIYVDIVDAGVKDIILPGEIRDIMNTVLVAEKKAQANVITRREEVASTRSLLNTAKLMDENATLYKLKELEYIERICENVGNITLNGSGDLLTQLSEILKANNN